VPEGQESQNSPPGLGGVPEGRESQNSPPGLGGVPEGRGGPYRVAYLPVDRGGLLKLADLEATITDQAAVVALMWANNETGVLFPVEHQPSSDSGHPVTFPLGVR